MARMVGNEMGLRCAFSGGDLAPALDFFPEAVFIMAVVFS